MTDVLCVGEPLISLTPAPHTSLSVADEVHLGVGGAELNVALHLARLGVDVAYAGAVGEDPFGTRLRRVLSAAGVDCAELRDAPGPTGAYFKEPGEQTRMLYYRTGSAGSQLRPLPAESLDRFGLVHVTGVTFGLQGEIARTVDLLGARPRSWRISFDVNFRPALWSAAEAGPVLLQAAQSANLVFVGRDEAEAVWGTDDSQQIQKLVGAEVELVIKDGPHDVEVWADGEWWRSTPPAITVVDPIGAGDAFAAAYLVARLRGCDPVASAEQGHALAGQVMSRVGDQ
ncbi:MAG: sugar kinase [Marmoricola sp.]